MFLSIFATIWVIFAQFPKLHFFFGNIDSFSMRLWHFFYYLHDFHNNSIHFLRFWNDIYEWCYQNWTSFTTFYEIIWTFIFKLQLLFSFLAPFQTSFNNISKNTIRNRNKILKKPLCKPKKQRRKQSAILETTKKTQKLPFAHSTRQTRNEANQGLSDKWVATSTMTCSVLVFVTLKKDYDCWKNKKERNAVLWYSAIVRYVDVNEVISKWLLHRNVDSLQNTYKSQWSESGFTAFSYKNYFLGCWFLWPSKAVFKD